MVLILALVEAPSWISAQFTNWQWRQECAVITVLSSWVLIFVRIVVRQRGRWQRWRKRKDLNLYFIKISAIINTFTWSRENRCTLTISKINKTYRWSWKPRCARRPFSSLTNKSQRRSPVKPIPTILYRDRERHPGTCISVRTFLVRIGIMHYSSPWP